MSNQPMQNLNLANQLATNQLTANQLATILQNTGTNNSGPLMIKLVGNTDMTGSLSQLQTANITGKNTLQPKTI